MDEVIYKTIMDVYENSEKLAVKVYEHGSVRAIVLIGGNSDVSGMEAANVHGQIAEDQIKIMQLIIKEIRNRLEQKLEKDVTVN